MFICVTSIPEYYNHTTNTWMNMTGEGDWPAISIMISDSREIIYLIQTRPTLKVPAASIRYINKAI
jgi:hypothetical protein